jgi:hypothetical protein
MTTYIALSSSLGEQATHGAFPPMRRRDFGLSGISLLFDVLYRVSMRQRHATVNRRLRSRAPHLLASYAASLHLDTIVAIQRIYTWHNCVTEP